MYNTTKEARDNGFFRREGGGEGGEFGYCRNTSRKLAAIKAVPPGERLQVEDRREVVDGGGKLFAMPRECCFANSQALIRDTGAVCFMISF